MKILSISLDRKVFEQGSAVRSRLLDYGRLVEELHIIVFTKKTGKFEAQSFSPNIFLYPTNTRTRLGYIWKAIFIAYAIKRRGVDIVVVSAQDPFETGLTAFLISRLIKAKFHLQIHTDITSPYFKKESLMNRARVLLAKFLIPRADAIRVVSERIRQSLLTMDYKLPAVSVLPIFIDTTVIENTPITHSLKKKYPQFEKHILMASRFTKEKNIGLALEAMSEVVKKYPKTGLIIVGSGPEELNLKLKIKNLRRALMVSRASTDIARGDFTKSILRHDFVKSKLNDNVVFEGWQDNLVPYYKTADVFLLTSNYEGYGMSVVEALVAGCPIVMTDVGCAGEIVRNGENGLVVPVDDEDALFCAIDCVLSGGAKLIPKLPKMMTKEEYLASYKKSWEDAFQTKK